MDPCLHPLREKDISIHALREEGDGKETWVVQGIGISIHALREEGDLDALLHADGGHISIHALREEGDSSWTARKCWA